MCLTLSVDTIFNLFKCTIMIANTTLLISILFRFLYQEINYHIVTSATVDEEVQVCVLLEWFPYSVTSAAVDEEVEPSSICFTCFSPFDLCVSIYNHIQLLKQYMEYDFFTCKFDIWKFYLSFLLHNYSASFLYIGFQSLKMAH